MKEIKLDIRFLNILEVLGRAAQEHQQIKKKSQLTQLFNNEVWLVNECNYTLSLSARALVLAILLFCLLSKGINVQYVNLSLWKAYF